MSLSRPPSDLDVKVLVWQGYVSYLGLYPRTLYHLPSRSEGVNFSMALVLGGSL